MAFLATDLPGFAVEIALNVVLEHDLSEFLPVVRPEVAEHDEAAEGEPGAVGPAVDPSPGGKLLGERLAVARDEILRGKQKTAVGQWSLGLCRDSRVNQCNSHVLYM